MCYVCVYIYIERERERFCLLHPTRATRLPAGATPSKGKTPLCKMYRYTYTYTYVCIYIYMHT